MKIMDLCFYKKWVYGILGGNSAEFPEIRGSLGMFQLRLEQPGRATESME